MNYYQILDVPANASQDEIKNAYRNMIKAFHPDYYRGNNKEFAERKTKELNEAYETLSNPLLREQYDRWLIHTSSPRREYTKQDYYNQQKKQSQRGTKQSNRQANEQTNKQASKQSTEQSTSKSNSADNKHHKKNPLIIVLFILLVVILLSIALQMEGVDFTPHLSSNTTADFYGKWSSADLGSIELHQSSDSVVPNCDLLSVMWGYNVKDQTVEIYYYLSSLNYEKFNEQYANDLDGKILSSEEAAEYLVVRNKIPPEGRYYYDDKEDKLIYEGTEFFLTREK